jgi:hypothetical protein
VGHRQHPARERAPRHLGEGKVRKFSLMLANFPFSGEFWWLKPEQ